MQLRTLLALALLLCSIALAPGQDNLVLESGYDSGGQLKWGPWEGEITTDEARPLGLHFVDPAPPSWWQSPGTTPNAYVFMFLRVSSTSYQMPPQFAPYINIEPIEGKNIGHALQYVTSNPSAFATPSPNTLERELKVDPMLVGIVLDSIAADPLNNMAPWGQVVDLDTPANPIVQNGGPLTLWDAWAPGWPGSVNTYIWTQAFQGYWNNSVTQNIHLLSVSRMAQAGVLLQSTDPNQALSFLRSQNFYNALIQNTDLTLQAIAVQAGGGGSLAIKVSNPMEIRLRLVTGELNGYNFGPGTPLHVSPAGIMLNTGPGGTAVLAVGAGADADYIVFDVAGESPPVLVWEVNTLGPYSGFVYCDVPLNSTGEILGVYSYNPDVWGILPLGPTGNSALAPPIF